MCRVKGEGESKIVFKEGDHERVIRGVITSEDNFFITLTRRDGIVKIAKSAIVKIVNRNSGSGSDGGRLL